MMKAKDKMFVALDVDTAAQALDLVRTLSECTDMFKIGMQLFTAEGPDLVRRIVDSGAKVFLDLKFHDIPNTVGAAAAAATRLGVFMFNIHAAGGSPMMRRAVTDASKAAADLGRRPPLIMGVTMLTSADATTLAENAIGRSMGQQVASLAKLAALCGLDGVIASPREVEIIRETVGRPDFQVLTPGIRPHDGANDDQKRVSTPGAAIKAGVDYLVVGRPITAARDPFKAASQILEEIQLALTDSAAK
jgi:orotidine-5'-phosphate decarboxylase